MSNDFAQITRFQQSLREDHLMNAKQKLHQAHLAEWTARFSDQRASGLTVRQWCDQNHVSIHKYNYWKHQLKEEVVDQMLPDIVPLAVTTPLSVTGPALPQNTQANQASSIMSSIS